MYLSKDSVNCIFVNTTQSVNNRHNEEAQQVIKQLWDKTKRMFCVSLKVNQRIQSSRYVALRYNK